MRPTFGHLYAKYTDALAKQRRVNRKISRLLVRLNERLASAGHPPLREMQLCPEPRAHSTLPDRRVVDAEYVGHAFTEAQRFNGMLTKIGAQLGVSANHVREVALGKRTSERVMTELIAEVSRIDGGVL